MSDVTDTAPLSSDETKDSAAEEKASSPYWEKHEAASPSEPEPVNAYYIDPPKPESSASTRAGGAVTMAVGGAVTLLGIPLLILPGPGILTVGGGIALMAKGAKDLLGNKGKNQKK